MVVSIYIGLALVVKGFATYTVGKVAYCSRGPALATLRFCRRLRGCLKTVRHVPGNLSGVM